MDSDDFGAMSVRAFAQRAGIGLTLAWREIAEGRLRAIKVSSRTLVRHSDARTWLDSRPDARAARPAPPPSPVHSHRHQPLGPAPRRLTAGQLDA